MGVFLEGYPNIEIIVYTATAKASAAAATVNLSTTLTNCEKVYVHSLNTNTDTVWLATVATVMSGTGYPILTGVALTFDINKPSGLYITSQGGDSKLACIFMGK